MTRVGRNERCPCGSGVKYKRCCEGRPRQGGDSDQLTLVVETSRGAMLRRIPAATPLSPGIPQGTAAEAATHRAAALWGLPDFVYKPAITPVGSGTRELGDGILLVGRYGLVVQVKSRAGPIGSPEKESRWLHKQASQGLAQANGTARRLLLGPTELRNLRGTSVAVDAGSYEWRSVIVIDHPSPPAGVVPSLADAKRPSVVMLRRDWEFLFDQLKSTYAVAQYIERVAGEELELGHEAARYYELAQEDAATPPEVVSEELRAGGELLSTPLLPMAPAATDDRAAHMLLRTLLEEIAVTKLQSSSELDRLRILSELDRLPVGQRARLGRRVLTYMEQIPQDATRDGLVWRMSSVRGFGGRVHLGYGTCSRPYRSAHVADGLRLWAQLRHYDVTQATGDPDGLTTVAVVVTPRTDGLRPWDTSVAAVSGPVSFEPGDLKILRELFPGRPEID